MTYRTDRNNNPAAFTTDIAREGGLILHVEYELGDSFSNKLQTLYTAKLIGDPIVLTIKVIDHIGYYTHAGVARWIYMAIPKSLWDMFTPAMKKQAVLEHYRHEGGTELLPLFVTHVDVAVSDSLKPGDSIK